VVLELGGVAAPGWDLHPADSDTQASICAPTNHNFDPASMTGRYAELHSRFDRYRTELLSEPTLERSMRCAEAVERALLSCESESAQFLRWQVDSCPATLHAFTGSLRATNVAVYAGGP
jgi:hypothetical protein